MSDQQPTALSCFHDDHLDGRTASIYCRDDEEPAYVLSSPATFNRITEGQAVKVPLLPVQDLETAAWDFLFHVAVLNAYDPPRWQFESKWRVIEKNGIQLLVSDAEYMAVHPHCGDLHGFLIYKPSGVILLDPISAFGSPDAFAKGFFDRDPEVLKAAREHTEGDDRRLTDLLNKMWVKDMLGARTKWSTHVRQWHRYGG